MAHQRFSLGRTYRIVVDGSPTTPGGGPDALALGWSRLVLTLWWCIFGVPESAVPPTRAKCAGCVHLFAPDSPEPFCDREGGCDVMNLRDDHKAWAAAHASIMVWDH